MPTRHIKKPTWIARLPILALIVLAAAGCNEPDSSVKIVHGSVSVDGQPVPMGYVRFVPIEGTPGPASLGDIEDGQYRIESRGGVPIGKHRVEVDARRKTGRQFLDQRGELMVDETVPVAPKSYAGKNSPLIEEVTLESDGRINITLPPI